MGNALSGIKHLAGTNSTNLDNVDGNETKVQSSLSQQQTSDTSDVDIAEEFDFLDEYEVEES